MGSVGEQESRDPMGVFGARNLGAVLAGSLLFGGVAVAWLIAGS